MEAIIAAIRAIRVRRNEMNVPPSRKAALHIVSDSSDIFNSAVTPLFEKLAYASGVEFTSSYESADALQIVTEKATVYIPMADMIDFEKELARLKAEREKTEGEIARAEKKLSNEEFVAKAPAAVVENERKKLASYRETLSKIEEAIQKIK